MLHPQHAKIEYHLSTEVYLANYASFRLTALSNGATYYTNIERILREHAAKPVTELRREERRGQILIEGDNTRVESSLEFADYVPLFSRVPNKRITIVSGGVVTDFEDIKTSKNNQPSEASVRNGQRDSLSIPLILNKEHLIRTLKYLTNVVLEPVDFEGSISMCVRGLNTDPESFDDYSFYLDQANDYLPRYISISSGGQKTLDCKIEYSTRPGFRNAFTRETMCSYLGGLTVYCEDWKVTKFSEDVPTGRSDFDFQIPVGTLVNEYRFQNSFTYFMGHRPPAYEELRKMSTDHLERAKYQQASMQLASNGGRGSKRFLVFLLALASGAFLFFFVKKSGAGQLGRS